MPFDSDNGLFWDYISVSLIAFSVLLHFVLHLVNAPYGRYSANKLPLTWLWRPAVNSRLGWFIQEAPAFIIPLLLVFFLKVTPTETETAPLLHDHGHDHAHSHAHDHAHHLPTANSFLISFHIIHYSQRCLLYPLLMKDGRSMPIVLVGVAFCFCTFNGFLQTYYLLKFAHYSPDWLTGPRMICGSILFFVGMAINIHSDHVLRTLRKPKEAGYKIPFGGAFTYVSSANYFGEILEWIGFAVACWTLPAFSFAVFTTANLLPRAAAHHRWYQKKFADAYPKDRMVLIPFLW